jgi:hypothetical protein
MPTSDVSTKGSSFWRTRDWFAGAIAVLSLCVAISSLCLSYKSFNLSREQARENEEQTRENQRRTAIQDTPVVSVEQDTDTDDPIDGLEIKNNGAVTAEVKDITFYVDRKPFDDVDTVIGIGKLDDVTSYEFGESDKTLAAGASEWLLGKRTKGKKKELDNFNDFIDQHVAVEYETCSIITGKCETKCSQVGWCK